MHLITVVCRDTNRWSIRQQHINQNSELLTPECITSNQLQMRFRPWPDPPRMERGLQAWLTTLLLRVAREQWLASAKGGHWRQALWAQIATRCAIMAVVRPPGHCRRGQAPRLAFTAAHWGQQSLCCVAERGKRRLITPVVPRKWAVSTNLPASAWY